MTPQEGEHYKALYEQGIQIINAMDKQNDGLQFLIDEKDKEIIDFANWIIANEYEPIASRTKWSADMAITSYTTEELYTQFRAAGCSAKNNGA